MDKNKILSLPEDTDELYRYICSFFPNRKINDDFKRAFKHGTDTLMSLRPGKMYDVEDVFILFYADKHITGQDTLNKYSTMYHKMADALGYKISYILSLPTMDKVEEYKVRSDEFIKNIDEFHSVMNSAADSQYLLKDYRKALFTECILSLIWNGVTYDELKTVKSSEAMSGKCEITVSCEDKERTVIIDGKTAEIMKRYSLEKRDKGEFLFNYLFKNEVGLKTRVNFYLQDFGIQDEKFKYVKIKRAGEFYRKMTYGTPLSVRRHAVLMTYYIWKGFV